MDTAIFHFKVNLRTTLSFETVHRSIPICLLNLSDNDLEIEANGRQNAYSDDFGSNFVSKLRSFRREFNTEIAA